MIDPSHLIEIGPGDALALACNAVELGDGPIAARGQATLRKRPHDAGYRVFSTELDEFIHAGRSATTLTLPLEDGPSAGAIRAQPLVLAEVLSEERLLVAAERSARRFASRRLLVLSLALEE